LEEDEMGEHTEAKLTAKAFGSLRGQLTSMGLPFEVEVLTNEEGLVARDLAERMSLAPEAVEAVFRNGSVINLYDRVFPGDRVAFFPPGTPGPYRVFLGMVRENLKRKELENEGTDVS
jgi:hypothetical protein